MGLRDRIALLLLQHRKGDRADHGGAPRSAAQSGVVPRVRFVVGGWRPAWPGAGAGSVARWESPMSGLARRDSQLNDGSSSSQRTLPPVISSILGQCFDGTGRNPFIH